MPRHAGQSIRQPVDGQAEAPAERAVVERDHGLQRRELRDEVGDVVGEGRRPHVAGFAERREEDDRVELTEAARGRGHPDLRGPARERRADRGGGEPGDHHVGVVATDRDDPVAGDNAERVERPRDLPDATAELPPCHLFGGTAGPVRDDGRRRRIGTTAVEEVVDVAEIEGGEEPRVARSTRRRCTPARLDRARPVRTSAGRGSRRSPAP